MKSSYQIPQTPSSVGGFDGRAIACAVMVFILANWIATQYCAKTFHYQPALGPPLLQMHRDAIYPPWKWAVWAIDTARHPEADRSVRATLLQSWVIVFLGFFAAVGAFYVAQHVRVRRMAREAKHLHGSAQWATRGDVKRSGLLDATHGVYVGGWEDRGRLKYLRHNGQDHVLVFAPTRTGKGVAVVLPTLLGSWFGSTVVYDIKGENWDKTAGFRATLGPVFRFAPYDLENSSRFNPLAEIRLDTDRDVADAQSIAQMIVSDGASRSDPYWHQAAEALLTGAILHVCYAAAREERIACINDVRVAMSEPGRDFRSTLGHWQRFHHLLDGSTHPAVATFAQEMLEKEDRNFDGVASQVHTALKVYTDPVVARNTSSSDFRIDDLVNFSQPVSLYLVVPAGQQERLRPLTRLLFTILVNRLTEQLRDNRHRLLLLIDEFPSLKRMDVFEHALSYIAGYGIKTLIIAQDIRQLEGVYGNKESIVSNCNVRVAFAPNTYETASLLSNMLGKQTILRRVYSFGGKRFSPMPGSMSTSMDHQERPLLTADEISRMRAPVKEGEGPEEKITQPGDQLVFVAGHRPILATQLLYFENPTLLQRSRMTAPMKRVAIDSGMVTDQPPLSVWTHVVNLPEPEPGPVSVTVSVKAPKGRKKKAVASQARLIEEVDSDDAFFPV